MPKIIFILSQAFILCLTGISLASAQDQNLKIVQLAHNNDVRTYALVGQMQQRSPENLGNNATFGLIVGSDKVILIDPGGSYKGAAQIDAAIKTITDINVTHVINSGGQDHRWIGNGYFQEKGAKIFASKAALEDQNARSDMQFVVMENFIGKDNFAKTTIVFADNVFDEKMELKVGNTEINIIFSGGAHTPGNSFVHIPDLNIIFTGDLVYLDRILGILEVSDTQVWLDSFDTMAALNPEIIVPGHGDPANLDKAVAQTRNYLVNLREKIGTVIENGGDMNAGTQVDQSTFSFLKQFDQLAKRNAIQLFSQMEFE